MPTPPDDPRRAEIALELAWLDVRDAFLAAKAAWVAAGSVATKPYTAEFVAYDTAKRKMSEMRTFWRRIGEAVGARTPAGTVVVETEEV